MWEQWVYSLPAWDVWRRRARVGIGFLREVPVNRCKALAEKMSQAGEAVGLCIRDAMTGDVYAIAKSGAVVLRDGGTPADLVSTADAAIDGDCSGAWVRTAIERGQLPAERVGGRWVIRRRDVARWLQVRRRRRALKADATWY